MFNIVPICTKMLFLISDIGIWMHWDGCQQLYDSLSYVVNLQKHE